MKQLVILIYVVMMGFVPLYAQKMTQTQYVEKFKNTAIREQRRSGVPAAITLAQGVLESESGNSYLAIEGRNHFGIKCKNEWTGGKLYKDDDERHECFRQYKTDDESYIDHSNFLKYRPYYVECFKIDVKDYAAWAKCLKKCGYATERNYPEMLTELIEKLKLQQYTLLALDAKYNAEGDNITIDKPVDKPENEAPKMSTVMPPPPNDVVPKTTPSVNEVQPKAVMATTIDAPETGTTLNEGAKKMGTYGRTIEINNVKAIMVYKETPLLTIAKKYNIPLAKLKTYNDLQTSDVVPNDQPVFLAPKKSWGSVDSYIYKSGETLYMISQQFGISLKSLMTLNNIKFGDTIPVGKLLKLSNTKAKNSFKEKVNRLLGK